MTDGCALWQKHRRTSALSLLSLP
nr:hypothetical protein [Escherichia coli]